MRHRPWLPEKRPDREAAERHNEDLSMRLPCGYVSCRLGGNTYALVLQHTADATHGMTLEVGKVYHEVIICKMASHQVLREPFCILHWKIHAAFLIHYIDCGDFSITALLDGSAVREGI